MENSPPKKRTSNNFTVEDKERFLNIFKTLQEQPGISKVDNVATTATAAVPRGKWKFIFALSIAELLGTATLMFIGCMGCIIDVYSTPVVQFAPLTFGLAVAMAVQMFGHISGGHFNPCVTIAAKIMNQIDWITLPFFFISQLAGAFLGYGLIMIAIPSELTPDLCVTKINPSITSVQGFLIETVITAMLIFLCCAIWDKRLSSQTDSVSIRLGLMLAGIFVATSQFTGASINPTRSLIPAIFKNFWTYHWVYWTGPPLGTVIAACIYKFTLQETPGQP